MTNQAGQGKQVAMSHVGPGTFGYAPAALSHAIMAKHHG